MIFCVCVCVKFVLILPQIQESGIKKESQVLENLF